MSSHQPAHNWPAPRTGARPRTARALATALAALCLAAGAVTASHQLRSGDEPQVSPTTVPGECPHLVPLPPGAGVAVDYASSLVWQGRTYLETEQPVTQPGPEVFSVRCSITRLTTGGLEGHGGQASEPFPDRTATHLPTGTSVREVPSKSAKCSLAAPGTRSGVGWVVFTAADCR